MHLSFVQSKQGLDKAQQSCMMIGYVRMSASSMSCSPSHTVQCSVG